MSGPRNESAGLAAGTVEAKPNSSDQKYTDAGQRRRPVVVPIVATPAEAHASMKRCPRFNRCSAPICPLDLNWRRRVHLAGEPTCGVALELQKGARTAKLGGAYGQQVVEEVSRALPKIVRRWPPIAAALERAAKSGSRVDNLVATRKGGRS